MILVFSFAWERSSEFLACCSAFVLASALVRAVTEMSCSDEAVAVTRTRTAKVFGLGSGRGLCSGRTASLGLGSILAAGPGFFGLGIAEGGGAMVSSARSSYLIPTTRAFANASSDFGKIR